MMAIPSPKMNANFLEFSAPKYYPIIINSPKYKKKVDKLITKASPKKQ